MSVERVRNSNQFSQKNNKPNLQSAKGLTKGTSKPSHPSLRRTHFPPSLLSPHSFPSLSPSSRRTHFPPSFLAPSPRRHRLPFGSQRQAPAPLQGCIQTSTRAALACIMISSHVFTPFVILFHIDFPPLVLSIFFLSLSPLVIYHLFLSAFGIFPLHHSLLVSHFPPCLSSSSLPSFWVFLQFL